MKRVLKRKIPVRVPARISEKDIRIGNLIVAPGRKIVKISFYNLWSILQELPRYRSLPITRELLLRSGFKMTRGFKYEIDILDGYYLYFTGHIGMVGKAGCGYMGHPIRYTHELQNIYYALTGKELPLTFS